MKEIQRMNNHGMSIWEQDGKYAITQDNHVEGKKIIPKVEDMYEIKPEQILMDIAYMDSMLSYFQGKAITQRETDPCSESALSFANAGRQEAKRYITFYKQK